MTQKTKAANNIRALIESELDSVGGAEKMSPAEACAALDDGMSAQRAVDVWWRLRGQLGFPAT